MIYQSPQGNSTGKVTPGLEPKYPLLRRLVLYLNNSFLNMCLRALTLASKFFLILALARMLSPAQIGIYGLFTVTISYTIFLLGLNFYTFSTRDMLARPRTDWPLILRDQFVFYAVSYLVFLPLCLFVFAAGILRWNLILWFYAILVLEHLSQEAYRILVAMQRHLIASLVLFLRMGCWVYVAIALLKFSPDLRNLTTIWGSWTFGTIASLVLAGLFFKDLEWKSARNTKVDWQWILRGVKIAIPFLFGTLAIRGIFTFDRYFLEIFHGTKTVGLYSFYMSLANALLSFIDAGIVVFYYPKLVIDYHQGNLAGYWKNIQKMAFSIVFVIILFSLCSWTLMDYILILVGKKIYGEHIVIFWALLCANSLFGLSLVPHFALYARGSDRPLVVISFFALFVFVLLVFLLIPNFGMVGLSWVIILVMFLILTLKSHYLYMSVK